MDNPGLDPNPRNEATRLGVLFGVMYFVQGICEPTEGLIAQPVRSMLKSWGQSTAEIAAFGALLALPWSVKPLYGLLTDFVPLAGSRRRNYLLLTGAASALPLIYIYLQPWKAGQAHLLFAMLVVPTVAVAFSDVVIDALMVEKGQPTGLTGRLQSVQWAAIYTAAILTGLVGGWLSQHKRQELGFLVCGIVALGSLMLVFFFVHEIRAFREKSTLRDCVGILWQTARTPGVLSIGAFLFLWNFNPFSSTVLYVHMTGELGLSEQFYGATQSLLAAASVVACVAYGFYCRRLSFRALVHLSIVGGILSTLAYWGLSERISASLVTWLREWLGMGATIEDARKISAVLVTLAVGFTYMTASLIQLDLAARICLPAAAGTTFAGLMALCNLSVSISMYMGGRLYDNWTAAWDSQTAFNLLVAVGAAFTACCWLLVPFLLKSNKELATPRPEPADVGYVYVEG